MSPKPRDRSGKKAAQSKLRDLKPKKTGDVRGGDGELTREQLYEASKNQTQAVQMFSDMQKKMYDEYKAMIDNLRA